ncbi:unnamed protein product, partial [Phaeothamnion confervicola]
MAATTEPRSSPTPVPPDADDPAAFADASCAAADSKANGVGKMAAAAATPIHSHVRFADNVAELKSAPVRRACSAVGGGGGGGSDDGSVGGNCGSVSSDFGVSASRSATAVVNSDDGQSERSAAAAAALAAPEIAEAPPMEDRVLPAREAAEPLPAAEASDSAESAADHGDYGAAALTVPDDVPEAVAQPVVAAALDAETASSAASSLPATAGTASLRLKSKLQQTAAAPAVAPVASEQVAWPQPVAPAVPQRASSPRPVALVASQQVTSPRPEAPVPSQQASPPEPAAPAALQPAAAPLPVVPQLAASPRPAAPTASLQAVSPRPAASVALRQPASTPPAAQQQVSSPQPAEPQQAPPAGSAASQQVASPRPVAPMAAALRPVSPQPVGERRGARQSSFRRMANALLAAVAAIGLLLGGAAFLDVYRRGGFAAVCGGRGIGGSFGCSGAAVGLEHAGLAWEYVSGTVTEGAFSLLTDSREFKMALSPAHKGRIKSAGEQLAEWREQLLAWFRITADGLDSNGDGGTIGGMADSSASAMGDNVASEDGSGVIDSSASSDGSGSNDIAGDDGGAGVNDAGVGSDSGDADGSSSGLGSIGAGDDDMGRVETAPTTKQAAKATVISLTEPPDRVAGAVTVVGGDVASTVAAVGRVEATVVAAEAVASFAAVKCMAAPTQNSASQLQDCAGDTGAAKAAGTGVITAAIGGATTVSDAACPDANSAAVADGAAAADGASAAGGVEVAETEPDVPITVGDASSGGVADPTAAADAAAAAVAGPSQAAEVAEAAAKGAAEAESAGSDIRPEDVGTSAAAKATVVAAVEAAEHLGTIDTVEGNLADGGAAAENLKVPRKNPATASSAADAASVDGKAEGVDGGSSGSGRGGAVAGAAVRVAFGGPRKRCSWVRCPRSAAMATEGTASPLPLEELPEDVGDAAGETALPPFPPLLLSEQSEQRPLLLSEHSEQRPLGQSEQPPPSEQSEQQLLTKQSEQQPPTKQLEQSEEWGEKHRSGG